MLEVSNLNVRLGGSAILSDISFSMREGQWLMIAGPNGAGKSTIINAISGLVAYGGRVAFESVDLKTLKPRQLASVIGVLSQNNYVGYNFSVEEVVRLGRYAYSGGAFSLRDRLRRKNNLPAGNRHDEALIDAALEQTGMSELRKRSVPTLSGGELQRTFLAQVIAQDPRIILLDEPSNHLDLLYQQQMFELINCWKNKKGKAVISVVHDLSLAKLYGTDAVLLDKGKVVASGGIGDVFTFNNLSPVYQMDIKIWMNSLLGQWRE